MIAIRVRRKKIVMPPADVSPPILIGQLRGLGTHGRSRPGPVAAWNGKRELLFLNESQKLLFRPKT
jgi:hypothetical protein